ncbi:putative amino acid transporter, transmembrane domain-containing protein [Helianthus annuus]|nr:putative amino acid transporter, transmembrane domain-containing protein [Helianthus annuus]KAJ0720259.1 putative amino acid transporter, transmembrane domain-containing protein [Helianthus annuus]
MDKEDNITGGSLQVEPASPQNGGAGPEKDLESAHTIGHDSFGQLGLLLITSFNCGYILSFSNLMLVPLGWIWGVISLILVGLITFYANWLLAEFHFVDGKRFIRYRDLMGHLFGRKMYYVTWVLQFSILILGNMGFLLLGGKALKEIDSQFSDSPLRLQYFVVITGVSYFVFALLVPTLSSMRRWLGISMVLTFTYITILLVVVFRDGRSNKDRNYDIIGSNNFSKVMNGFGAISAIIVCNTSGILPELQSTLCKPAIANMKKALYLQYSVGLFFYYGVSIVGYWAYGSAVSTYLPEELSGPKWASIMINAISFVQSIISQHMFIAPIHETLDTKFLRLDKSIHSRENIKNLLLLRAMVFTGNTLVTAAFPFMGDFVNLLGSFSLIPLTFVFPSMIYIKVKGKSTRLEKNVWHGGIIVLFSLLTIATTISAIRSIVRNVRQYNLFADT